MTPPDRLKPREAWTPAEHATHMSTGVVPASDEFVAYVRETLAGAGLDVNEIAPDYATGGDGAAMALEDMTPAQHFERLRRR